MSIRQGGVLSPHLFDVLIDDLQKMDVIFQLFVCQSLPRDATPALLNSDTSAFQ